MDTELGKKLLALIYQVQEDNRNDQQYRYALGVASYPGGPKLTFGNGYFQPDMVLWTGKDVGEVNNPEEIVELCPEEAVNRFVPYLIGDAK